MVSAFLVFYPVEEGALVALTAPILHLMLHGLRHSERLRSRWHSGAVCGQDNKGNKGMTGGNIFT